MVLAKVVGSVVSTIKEPRLEGIKFLLLEKIDVKTLKGKKDFVVAMDAVGAGEGEIVFFVGGSSSRQTETTSGKPSDATIIAIVDSFDIQGKTIYSKSGSSAEQKKDQIKEQISDIGKSIRQYHFFYQSRWYGWIKVFDCSSMLSLRRNRGKLPGGT